jgi:CubicO group peptidase (beta-lactamase class C family)
MEITRGWALAAVLVGCGATMPENTLDAAHEEPPPVDGGADAARPSTAFSVLLENARAAHGVPALAALELREGQVVHAAAVGVRRVDREDAVSDTDPWHLGSCTKAMTAAVVARLADRGVVSFDSTMAELFPDLAIDPALRDVTLHQLLVHRGGLPEDRAPTPDIVELLTIAGPVREARAEVARRVLSRPPAVAPGTETRYSNFGYVLVGAALERATHRSWEELVEAELFEPLALGSCGFGPPAAERSDAPSGHLARDGALEPVPRFDNPPLLGPAGTVHCSLSDWARFVDWTMAPPTSGPLALSEASQARLRTPTSDGFAAGWLVATRPWARGPVLFHRGSNTSFLAVVWAVPEERRVLLAATNAATEGGRAALEAAIVGMIESDER